MKRQGIAPLMVVATMLIAAPALAQQETLPSGQIVFDVALEDVSKIGRFELQIDGGAWQSVGLPAATPDARTASGSTSYRVPVPALTPGSHAATVRACHATAGCAAASAELRFTFIVVQAPTNLRIREGG